MKFLTLCFWLTSLAITNIYAQQSNPELPDYTKWLKEADHKEVYIYAGKDTPLRDQHYILEQSDSTQLVLVFYRPEDENKPWFVIHMVLNSSDNLSGYLFERKDGVWSFAQNLSENDLNDMATVFKSRYGLEYKK